MEVVGWRCDHTGEYFPHKDTYLRHLKRLATSRRFNRIAKREGERVVAEHGPAIWNLTTIKSIFAYIEKNLDDITFHYTKDRKPQRPVRFEVLSYAYDDDRREWIVEVSLEFETDSQSTYALMHGLKALDISYQDLMAKQMSRYEKNGRFAIRNQQHRWDKLKMTEMLHGRINA